MTSEARIELGIKLATEPEAGFVTKPRAKTASAEKLLLLIIICHNH